VAEIVTVYMMKAFKGIYLIILQGKTENGKRQQKMINTSTSWLELWISIPVMIPDSHVKLNST